MTNTNSQRPLCRARVLMAALLAGMLLLERVQSIKSEKKALAASADECYFTFSPRRRVIDLEITQCVLRNYTSEPNKVSVDITKLRARFNSLSKKKKNQLYRVSITNRSFMCLTGCCEVLMMGLVHRLASIEGLRVGKLHVRNIFTVSRSRFLNSVLEMSSTVPPLRVHTLKVCNMTFEGFHSICSVVQVCAADASGVSAVAIDRVSCINFEAHPLKCAWSVSSVKIKGARAVNLGQSVQYLPRGSEEEDSAAPGLWIKEGVVVEYSANCCMGNSVVGLVHAGMPLEGSVGSLGFAVPKDVSGTKLLEAIYKAVWAIRQASTGPCTQRYVLISKQKCTSWKSQTLFIDALNDFFLKRPRILNASPNIPVELRFNPDNKSDILVYTMNAHMEQETQDRWCGLRRR